MSATKTKSKKSTLIEPYGGKLVDLMVPAAEVPALLNYAKLLPSVRLSHRAMCDLELMAVGAFSPLDQFMGEAELQSVLDNMRLLNGAIFPMPITLPIDPRDDIRIGQQIALRDERNNVLALMTVHEMYEWDLDEVATKAFGANDVRHPIVAEMNRWGKVNISGPIQMLALPEHYDFADLRRTPAETRAAIAATEHQNVVAFQTRNPLHRVHEELTKRAASSIDGVLLLHPVVGLTKPGDVDHYTRVRTYKALAANYYDQDRIVLSLLPLAMRMGGPREALWHALIRRNYGANHIIVGRDHAGPGKNSQGEPFYGPYDAQDLVVQYQEELGVTMIPFRMLVYLPEEQRYEEIDKVPQDAKTASISGTQVREDYLAAGRELPTWFTRPEVAKILAETHPPKHRQGVCIWFTGLAGSGKSTNAYILTSMLQEFGRQVTLLDGNVVRTHFSEGLGFSKEDRDTNVRRMGYVASEIVAHGGVVVCSSVSPYRATRNEVRNMVGANSFIEVFVDAPLEVAEARDSKGLYARARAGELKNFTGIDDPYEAPQSPEVHLDAVNLEAVDNAKQILNLLLERGFIKQDEIYVNGNGSHK